MVRPLVFLNRSLPTAIARRWALILLAGAAGCAGQKAAPPTIATNIAPKKALSEYWFNLPAVEHVEASDYDTLWKACEKSLTDSSFIIERVDYREGFMTSKPLISKQFFEFWKHDIVDFRSQIQSDLGTRRRVAHFQIEKLDDTHFVCEPKVVIEHYAEIERRITAVYQYQDAFSVHRELEEETTDEGTAVHLVYWYGERRDEALEHALAERLRENLQQVARAN